MGRMEFYRVAHPARYMPEEFAMVELGESRRGMFMLFGGNYNENSVLQLFSSNRSNHGEGASEWVLENTVRLSLTYKFNMLGVADGKLLLQGTPEFGCMSLDFKTSQLQRVRGMIYPGYWPLALYTGYPPSLSLPTI